MVYTTNTARKSFTTKDGATLSYLEQGDGAPIIFIHGCLPVTAATKIKPAWG